MSSFSSASLAAQRAASAAKRAAVADRTLATMAVKAAPRPRVASTSPYPAKRSATMRKDLPSRSDFQLSAESRRELHGQIYSYINRLVRNPKMNGDYDEEKLRSLMLSLADVFSDSVAQVELGSFAQQTDLEDRYGAYPSLMARVVALSADGPCISEPKKQAPRVAAVGNRGVALIDNLGQGVALISRLERKMGQRLNDDSRKILTETMVLAKQASNAASLAAATTYEAIDIAHKAKKNSRASVPARMAWNKRLDELRSWADCVKKSSCTADEALGEWGKHHERSSGRATGNAEAHCRGTDCLSPAVPVEIPTQLEIHGRKRRRIDDSDGLGSASSVESVADCEKKVDAKEYPDAGKAAGGVMPPAPVGQLPYAGTSHKSKASHIAAAASNAALLAKVASTQLSWEAHYQHLLHYEAGFGNCDVPGNYSTNSAPGLGRFVMSMRQNYRETGWQKLSPEGREACSKKNQYGLGLTEDRVGRLEAAGFRWRVVAQYTPFSERLEQLQKFKAENGHTMVPRSHPIKGFGYWCKDIRQRKKVGDLDAYKLRELEAIGFDWSAARGAKRKSWQESFEVIVDFRRTYGHCNAYAIGCSKESAGPHRTVTVNGIAREDPDLYKYVKNLRSWSTNQRAEHRKLKAGQRSRIDKAKVRKLERIGFVFEPKGQKPMVGGDSDDEEE